VMEIPSLPPAQRVVPGRRKRYHPLNTLQTQGRMHVQMYARGARAAAGEVVAKTVLADRRGSPWERA
jgi:hypothetical protein